MFTTVSWNFPPTFVREQTSIMMSMGPLCRTPSVLIAGKENFRAWVSAAIGPSRVCTEVRIVFPARAISRTTVVPGSSFNRLQRTEPAIGRLERDPRVFYAFGHQHLGMTMSATTAELIEALALGKKPAIDLAPFRVERFA